MKILAIDTSTKFLSLAIAEDNRILAKFHEENPMKHASLLIPTIDSLLKKNKLRLKNIDVIVLSIGPGSFTGLRIGVATSKGLSLGLGIPIVAIPTLDVIAYNFINEEKLLLCPVIDAKKNKIYSSFYHSHRNKLHRLSGNMLIDIDALLGKIKKPTLMFGDAIKLYSGQLKGNKLISISKKEWYPRAEVLIKMGFEEARKRKFVNPDKLAPLYLHSQYCQIKGHKG